MSLTVGIDIGGTKVAGGVVDEDGNVLARLREPTPNDSNAIIDTIVSVAARLRSDFDVDAVGLAAAGFIDADRSHVIFAPNLAWEGEPLRKHVGDRLNLPVVVENDVNATAWGEARFGAGRGEAHLACIAVGTGIGGGILLGGRLYRGRYGIAAEMGHFRVVPDGRPCGCGKYGCWEQYASGPALVREARERAAADTAAADRLLDLAGGSLSAITGPLVTQAARKGCPVALAAFDGVGTWLGEGLADLAAILDPGAFVIGGGVSEAGDLLITPTRAAFQRALTGGDHRPFADVRVAELGTDAPIVGAADLARRR